MKEMVCGHVTVLCSVFEMTFILVAKGGALFPDCLGHAHVLLAAFERVSGTKLRFEIVEVF